MRERGNAGIQCAVLGSSIAPGPHMDISDTVGRSTLSNWIQICGVAAAVYTCQPDFHVCRGSRGVPANINIPRLQIPPLY